MINKEQLMKDLQAELTLPNENERHEIEVSVEALYTAHHDLFKDPNTAPSIFVLLAQVIARPETAFLVPFFVEAAKNLLVRRGDQLSPSEAVLAFCLSVFSDEEEEAGLLMMAGTQFCVNNYLALPRPGWQQRTIS